MGGALDDEPASVFLDWDTVGLLVELCEVLHLGKLVLVDCVVVTGFSHFYKLFQTLALAEGLEKGAVFSAGENAGNAVLQAIDPLRGILARVKLAAVAAGLAGAVRRIIVLYLHF